MRIRATGVAYTPPEPEDPSQSSLTLDSSVIAGGFKESGQDNITDSGQGPFMVYVPDGSRIRAYLIKCSAERNLEQQLDQLLQDCEQATHQRTAGSRYTWSLRIPFTHRLETLD